MCPSSKKSQTNGRRSSRRPRRGTDHLSAGHAPEREDHDQDEVERILELAFGAELSDEEVQRSYVRFLARLDNEMRETAEKNGVDFTPLDQARDRGEVIIYPDHRKPGGWGRMRDKE
jgi:hypothetical protein